MSFTPTPGTFQEPLDQWIRMVTGTIRDVVRRIYPRTRAGFPRLNHAGDEELFASLLAQAMHGATGPELETRLRESPEFQANQTGPKPPPDPKPDPDPTPGPTPGPTPTTRPIYATHRSDGLTMVLANGKPERFRFDSSDRYHKRSDADRKAARDAHVAAGMTRYWLSPLKDGDGNDFFANPQALVPFLKELHAAGLGVCLSILPEDAPAMIAKYLKPGIAVYCAALEKALRVWEPWTTEVSAGVEISETVPREEDQFKIADTVRKVIKKPRVLSVHMGSGQVRPKGTSPGYWKRAAAHGITDADYQVKHEPVEDGGGAFSANPDTIKTELRALKVECGNDVNPRCMEYVFFGRQPSDATVKKVVSAGRVLAAKALEEVDSTGNGGAGYWAPESPKPVPPDTVDAVPVDSVTWFTQTAQDQSKEIRQWSIDSKLTPRFSGGDIHYDHTASKVWPVKSGSSVNANCWNIFKRNGRLEGYTIDYLRPGENDKPWEKVNQQEEPPTGWTAKTGETMYVMVSRIARHGTYPNGKSRSNIVKITVP